MHECKVVVKSYEKALHEVDVFCRYNDAERVGTENKDQHCYECTDEHGLGIVARRIFDFTDMNARHFHSGIEEKYGACEDDVVEI